MHQNSQKNSFLPFNKTSFKQECRAIFILLGLLIIFRFQAILKIDYAFIGGAERDAGLYIWLAKSNLRDFFEMFFNTRGFYPYGQSLAWSDNFLLPSFVVGFFNLMGIPFVLSYNLMLLLCFLLNGYCTYFLTFQLTSNFVCALFSGAVFMLSSCMTAYLGHPQLQFVFVFPAGILALFYFLNNPSFLRSLLPSLFLVISFFCCVYYTSFLALTYVCLIVAIFLLRPKHFKIIDLFKLSFGGFLAVLILSPFLQAYFQVKRNFGQRFLFEPYFFANDIRALFSATEFNLIYNFSSGWSHAEANLFSGFIILLGSFLSLRRLTEARPLKSLVYALISCFILLSLSSLKLLPFAHLTSAFLLWAELILAVLFLYKFGALERKLGFEILTNRDLIAIFAFITLVFFLVSMGPLGNVAEAEQALGLSTLLYYVFPGFDSIRAIGRAGIVSMFSLIICASFALTHFSKTRKWKWQYFSILALLLVLENWARIYPLQAPPVIPENFEKLKELPSKDDVVLVLPMSSNFKNNLEVDSWGNFAELNINYLEWVFPSGKFALNGYSGIRSKAMLHYPGLFKDFPDAKSLAEISKIVGLRYIVFVSNYDPSFNAESFALKLKQFPNQLKFINLDLNGSYLFEYVGQTKITPNLVMNAPAYLPNSSFLNFEFMVDFGKAVEAVYLTPIIKDQNGDQILAEVKLLPNAQWESYSFAIPKLTQGINPLNISFILRYDKVSQKATNPEVYLRNSRLIWGQN